MITASGLERCLACPASCALPGEDTPSNEWSDRGNALDAAVNPDDDSEIPEQYAADAAELAEAIKPLLPDTVQHQVAFEFDIATGEGKLTGVHDRQYRPAPFGVPGTADFWAPGFVADAKSGFRDVTTAGRNPQLLIAACANAAIYGLDSVDVAIIDTRHPDRPRIQSSATVDVFDLEDFRGQLRQLHLDVVAMRKKRATEGGLTIADVSPGEHCRYCPSLRSCPATLQLVRDDISQEVEVAWAGELTPQTAPQAYEQFRHLEKVVKRMSQILYGYAAKNPIQLPSGKVFGKRTKPGKERLDGEIAWQVLKEQYGPDVAAAAVKFVASKSGIRNALRVVSGKGELSKREKAVIETIRERGGSERRETTRVEEYTRR